MSSLNHLRGLLPTQVPALQLRGPLGTKHSEEGCGLGLGALDGFLKWGYPHRWMVDFMENPIYEWMMSGGTPISGNPQMLY